MDLIKYYNVQNMFYQFYRRFSNSQLSIKLQFLNKIIDNIIFVIYKQIYKDILLFLDIYIYFYKVFNVSVI